MNPKPVNFSEAQKNTRKKILLTEDPAVSYAERLLFPWTVSVSISQKHRLNCHRCWDFAQVYLSFS